MNSKLVDSNKYIGIAHMHYNIWIQCHKICDNGNYNCSRNTIGPVYPGQVLEMGLCRPWDDRVCMLCHAELVIKLKC